MRIAGIGLVLLVVGCSDGEAARPVTRTLLRTETTAPRVLTYPTQRGEVLVMEVFTREGTQRCYVWRDAEFRSAAMQCPAGDEPLAWERTPDEPAR